MKRIWIPQVVVIGMLLWALYPNNPYVYYIALRWVCTAVFVFLAVHAYLSDRQGWVWTLGLLALVFNPIAPFYFKRDVWQIIDIVAASLAALSIFRLPKDHIESHSIHEPAHVSVDARMHSDDVEPDPQTAHPRAQSDPIAPVQTQAESQRRAQPKPRRGNSTAKKRQAFTCRRCGFEYRAQERGFCPKCGF